MTSQSQITSVVTLRVKPEDIDMYQHLTYSRYLEYFKNGGLALMKESRVNLDELYSRNIGVVVTNTTIKYYREIKENEEVQIHSNFLPYMGDGFFEISHEMRNNRGLIATCTDRNLFVKFNGKPIPIPIPRELETLIAELEGGEQ